MRKMFNHTFEKYIDPINSITYLESSAIRNLPIYERFGFRAVTDIYLGDKEDPQGDNARMDVMVRGPKGETWKYLEETRRKYGYAVPEASVLK